MVMAATSTTSTMSIQQLPSLFLRLLQIIVVAQVILTTIFISSLECSVHGAAAGATTTTVTFHEQNNRNLNDQEHQRLKRWQQQLQQQQRRELQLPRFKDAPAPSQETASTSISTTSTSTAPPILLQLDATTSYDISNDYNFHYMVTLTQPSMAATDADTDTAVNADHEPTVRFYWKTPSHDSHDSHSRHSKYRHNYGHGHGQEKGSRKIVQCRIVHESTPLLASRTSWLGFGIQDKNVLLSSPSSSSLSSSLTGSEALIGFMENDNDSMIEQYVLKDNFQTEGSVEGTALTSSSTTTTASKPLFMEGESYLTRITHSDNRVTTTFDFTMLLYDDDNDDDNKNNNNNNNGDSLTNEKVIHEHEENLFIFAIGPAESASQILPNNNNSTSTSKKNIGAPVKTGSLKLNFHQIGSTTERSYLNVIDQQSNCTSDDGQYEYMLALRGNIKLYWTLSPNKDWIDVKFSHLGRAWVALGIADPNANINVDDAGDGVGVVTGTGRMIGSDAVICRPALSAAANEPPLKYHLSSYSQNGVYPMHLSRQTLTGTSCTQGGDGDYNTDNDDGDIETILRFTKQLVEDGENPISITNVTTFLYAIGEGNILAKHAFANSFQLDVNKCPIDVVADSATQEGNYMARWIAHGVFGTLAFAVALPSSLASAFLRQLIPTTWIFFHVYGNLVAFTLALITFFIAISTMSKRGEDHFTESHHKIGLTLVLLLLFQILGGIFRPDKASRQNPYLRTKRNIWKWLHHVLGITILSLGLYQVGDGLIMFSEDYETPNLAPMYFVILFICFTVVGGTKLWTSFFLEERTFTGGESEVDTEVENLQRRSRYPETEMT